MKIHPIVPIALLALLAAAGCQPDESQATSEPGQERERARVEVSPLQTESFDSTAILTGTTEPNDIVRVAAEMPGRVLSVGFEEGEDIEKGTTMIRVDARTDRAMLGQYRVQKEQASRDVARTRDLFSRGLATQADVERAETALKMANASVRMAQTGVGKSSVSAPITGVIDTSHVEPGEYVNPGAPIATIVNYDLLLVRVPLPESMLLTARPGAEVKVDFPALKRSAKGKIRRVGVQANEGTRTFPMLIEVTNTDRTLRPGLRANVTLVTQRHPDAVLIPRDAIIEGLHERYVFVLDGDKAKRVVVTLGDGAGDKVQALTGLEAGDKLITVGHRELADGDAVNVLEASK